MPASPFQVLTVCTGNVARSPYAERVLAAGFAQLAARAGWDAQVRVGSAGTRALVGEPMTPETVELATAAGVDPHGHAARQLTAGQVESAGLVLALTREHRRDVVRTVPRASRYTFALAEFARLVADLAADPGVAVPVGSPGSFLTDVVDAAGRRRGFVPPPEDPAVDDVVDPYGHPADVYARATGQISAASATIFDALSRLLAAGSRS